MPKGTRYSQEAKGMIVARLESGENLADLAREYDLTTATLKTWQRLEWAREEVARDNAEEDAEQYGIIRALLDYLPASGQWTREERGNWLGAIDALLDLYIHVIPDTAPPA